jgi:hypothetical protein
MDQSRLDRSSRMMPRRWLMPAKVHSSLLGRAGPADAGLAMSVWPGEGAGRCRPNWGWRLLVQGNSSPRWGRVLLARPGRVAERRCYRPSRRLHTSARPEREMSTWQPGRRPCRGRGVLAQRRARNVVPTWARSCRHDKAGCWPRTYESGLPFGMSMSAQAGCVLAFLHISSIHVDLYLLYQTYLFINWITSCIEPLSYPLCGTGNHPPDISPWVYAGFAESCVDSLNQYYGVGYQHITFIASLYIVSITFSDIFVPVSGCRTAVLFP